MRPFAWVTILLACLAVTGCSLHSIDPPEPDPEPVPIVTPFESAADAVLHMGAGWNLGNTLDSNSGSTDHMWIEAYTSRTP